MRILWVAATLAELESVPSMRAGWTTLVTGCGPAAAGARLGFALGRSPTPELVVGIGIAGAYPETGIELGAVVRVATEGFADLGCQDGADFVDLLDLGLPDTGLRRHWDLSAPAFLDDLSVVRGTTCSVCTGALETAAERRRRTGASIESMEGAAWALACQVAGVPFAQVRAISNVAGPRDRPSWRIPQAMAALKRRLEESCRSI
jgi:futalosine hydrolase